VSNEHVLTPEWGQRRTSFGVAARDYADGRPHYPREALEWALADEATSVLDLGAGTGILTHDLLALGLDVVSVEPLPQMRALIPAPARAVDGTAEAIPLDDGSVDAVVVGQAWHWFDADAALAETRRVLRRGGTLVLVWNLLDTSDALTRTIAEIVDAEERTDMSLGAVVEPPFKAPKLFAAAEQLLIPHVQGYDRDRITQFAMSRSQSILLDPDAREALLERLRGAVPSEPFTVNWFCEAWRAEAI
jgi:SAM-dependent methyltransferase